jgi:hypothetical protein
MRREIPTDADANDMVDFRSSGKVICWIEYEKRGRVARENGVSAGERQRGGGGTEGEAGEQASSLLVEWYIAATDIRLGTQIVA